MARQEQTRPSRRGKPQQEVEEVSTAAPSTQEATDLLDEIDEVLEEQAEEFVNAYVQRGGQ